MKKTELMVFYQISSSKLLILMKTATLKKNAKIIIFDVDGVLLDNRLGGFKDVLVLLGKKKEVEKIDKEYQKRKNIGPWGLEELAKLYRHFSLKKLRKITSFYCQDNLRSRAKETICELKKKGYLVGALSSNPQFIMDFLAQILRLDFSFGTQLEFKNDKATGKIIKKIDRYGKAEILKEIIKEQRAKKKNVVVVGDSITDLPMAQLAGVFIAFSPKDKVVKEKATKVINSFQKLSKEL